MRTTVTPKVIDVGVSPKMNQGQLHKELLEVAVFAKKHSVKFPFLFSILPSDTIVYRRVKEIAILSWIVFSSNW